MNASTQPLIFAIEQAKIALCQGDPKTGAMTPEAVKAFWELADWKERLLEQNDLGRCCHETLESRLGACDGGERCRRQATHEINGSAFCERHGN